MDAIVPSAAVLLFVLVGFLSYPGSRLGTQHRRGSVSKLDDRAVKTLGSQAGAWEPGRHAFQAVTRGRATHV